MWNNKPEPQLQPTVTPPGNRVATPAAPATASPSFHANQSANRGTTIGEEVSIIGDIYCEEDLFINGEVRGALEIKDSRLTVGPKGKAESNVKAREVIILGSVKGDVEASSKITIRNQGSLVGNIKTSGIVIDDDAYFKGSIDIIRKPPASALGEE